MPIDDEKQLLLHDVSKVEDLKKLLLSGADVNETNNLDETPLLTALRREGNSELIKEFVFQGADVNAKDCWGVTPLYCAIARHGKDLNIIRFLLKNGADIQSGKRAFDRFLDHTVTHNRDCAKLLIKYKFLKNSQLVIDLPSISKDQTERDYYNEYKAIVDLDLRRASYNFLSNYLDLCSSEIIQMKSVNLFCLVTLLDFASTKNPLQTLVDKQNVQQMIDEIYKEFTVNKYKVYKDVIVDQIGRERLLTELEDKFIYTKLCRKHSNNKQIILNVDLVYYIAKYLSDVDLFNLVIASKIK